MTPEQKEWIDNASYEELLRKWRYSTFSDPLFRSETGTYFSEALAEYRKTMTTQEKVAISKRIGFS